MEKINLRWKRDTFKAYHSDKDKFVEEVLTFFFDEIPEDAAADDENAKYIYCRDNKNYYCLKADKNIEYSTANKYYKRFARYYSNGSNKLKSLYKELRLKCLGRNPVLVESSDDNSKDKSSSSNESEYKIKNETISTGDQVNNGDTTGSNLLKNNPYLTANDINLTNNSNDSHNTKDSHDTITNNITYVFNNLFKSNLGYTIEDLVYQLKTGEVYLKADNPIAFINVLKNVFLANYKDENYRIFTMSGEHIRGEDFISIFVYKSDGHTDPQNLLDFIKKNKPHFMSKLEACRFSRDKIKLDKVDTFFDKEAEYVDKIIGDLWHECIYGPRRSYEGIKGTEILNVKKFKECIETPENGDIHGELIKILKYTNDRNFVPLLENFIREKSKKYEFRYNDNGSIKRGKDHGEALIFKKYK